MKVYVVLFHYEEETQVEGVFKTKQDAKNYVVNHSVEYGWCEGEISIEEFELDIEIRKSKEDLIKDIKACDLLSGFESDDEAIDYLTGWVEDL